MHKKATYLRIVAKIREEKKETHRVRFTVGNLIQYDGNVRRQRQLTHRRLDHSQAHLQQRRVHPRRKVYDDRHQRLPPEHSHGSLRVHTNPRQRNSALRINTSSSPSSTTLANDRHVKHLPQYGFVQALAHSVYSPLLTFPLSSVCLLMISESNTQATNTPSISPTPSRTSTLSAPNGLAPVPLGLTLDWDYEARTVDLVEAPFLLIHPSRSDLVSAGFISYYSRICYEEGPS
jgi:hypothetical protein